MPSQDGVDDGPLWQKGLAGLGLLLPASSLGLEVVDVEAQDVAVLDGVGDGVGVELLLEQVFGGLVRRHLAVDLDAMARRPWPAKDGRAGEAEELRLGEERFDGLVVLAELRAVAFVKDEDDALVLQRPSCSL